ncbi:MAG: hypothetical protein HYX89_02865 [Chloroflexi bacterium]|nr:hypothetical protein [Chloroflexota bacterium]
MNGSAGDMLDLHPVTTIDDLLPAVETVDLDDLSRVLQTHLTGVSVLVAPRRPVDAERVPPALIARILKLAKQAFEYTIVDTGADYGDHTLEILEQSDRILLVVTPEVAVLRNATMFLEITEGLGYRDRVAVVVNRANTGVGLEQVEQVLEIPAFATIVSAGHMVVESGNAGQAWVITHRNTEAAQDIWRLAAAVDGTIIKTTAVVRPQVAQQRPRALTALLPRVAMLPLGFIGGLR